MQFLEQNGIELRRIRLSQSSPHEPVSARLDPDWQGENDCTELFLLTEVVDGQAGRDEPPAVESSSSPAESNPPPPAARHGH
jgi:hypothetical protein